jgi:hypothetical protein
MAAADRDDVLYERERSDRLAAEAQASNRNMMIAGAIGIGVVVLGGAYVLSGRRR